MLVYLPKPKLHQFLDSLQLMHSYHFGIDYINFFAMLYQQSKSYLSHLLLTVVQLMPYVHHYHLVYKFQYHLSLSNLFRKRLQFRYVQYKNFQYILLLYAYLSPLLLPSAYNPLNVMLLFHMDMSVYLL